MLEVDDEEENEDTATEEMEESPTKGSRTSRTRVKTLKKSKSTTQHKIQPADDDPDMKELNTQRGSSRQRCKPLQSEALESKTQKVLKT